MIEIPALRLKNGLMARAAVGIGENKKERKEWK
jgi:hypothetical protein